MAESGRSGYGRRLPPVAAAFLAVLALGLLAGCRQQAAAPTVEPDAAPVAFHAQGEPELLVVMRPRPAGQQEPGEIRIARAVGREEQLHGLLELAAGRARAARHPR